MVVAANAKEILIFSTIKYRLIGFFFLFVKWRRLKLILLQLRFTPALDFVPHFDAD